MAAVNKKLAARVRQLRQQRSWTQAQLGRAAGLTFKFVGQIERAEVSPTLTSLEKLARGLNLSLPDLLSFAERPARKAREEIVLSCSQADLKVIQRSLGILHRLFRK
ncbi:MAG TPA: helix-turn-helix transcriptional regulator [Candidatus Acidoferrales bacterium]|nr:helix-turn-helix transcriptional regulator [Candidatus Acidoferrales bacterium]